MERNARLLQVMDLGTGLSFIVFPLVFTFAFAVHPGLLHPQLLAPAMLIARAHHAGLLQFGHVLVTLNTALAVVIALRFMKLLERTSWTSVALVGGAAGILGAFILAADKGALCLTMTALDTVPAETYAPMMPGLVAMFSLKGWMALLWGVMLLPLGFAILAVALLETGALPRWQSALFLSGVLLVGFPDGAEIVNLTASMLMAAGLVPYGMQLVLQQFQRLGTQEAGLERAPTLALRPREACPTCRRR
jgi:hypothetical protein